MLETAETRPVAGHPTHVVRAGHGAREAMFIHCTLGQTATWARVMAALEGRLSMTAFDRPGHGASAAWPGQGGALGLHSLTTQIAAALIEGQADVIGHSYGATVALRLAMEYPERVRSLTLIEPPLFKLAEGGPAHRAHFAEMAEVDAALAAGEAAQAARLFNDAVNPDNPWSGLAERARDRLARQVGLIADETGVTSDDVAGLGAPGRLEAVRLPVMLVEGSASPAVFGTVQDRLAARLADARRVVMEGAGHMSPLTHPEALAAELVAFLDL